MFNFFKKKCAVCGMELEKGKDYPKEFGKEFCSEKCKEEYRAKLKQEESQKPRSSCCH